ncbi:hypothetical protein CNMCM7691_000160 [Aspergillus felis]|uniref:ERT1/acuK family PAS domain-containing protein n=1 Tax=Aspergillus felis TaxID=1287682 RepID=A0A8H6QXH4_9EURO|nr:hypothetical protein CNMCM7691_000160 [Aspergillus felis]
MTENGAAQTGTAPDEQPRNGTMENVKLNMAEGDSSRMESGSKNTASPPVKADNSAVGTHSSPKKRRKTTLLTTVPTLLQHASTVDDREPSKRARSEHELSTAEEEGHSNNEFSSVQGMPRNVDVQDSAGQQILADGTIALPPSSVSAVQHNSIPSSSAQNSIGPNSQQLLGYNDWLGGQSQFQDMHTFHPSYMFNAPEVTNEYNLLGDFLSSSLLDDGGIFPNDNLQGIYSDPTLINSMANPDNTALLQQAQPPQPTQSQPPQNDSVQGPSSTVVNDKARETYYMTAADPSGSDPPEERMNKLLKAKYDAGLLKPFNYVKGYARLNQYMEKNMKQSSRQKILRQLDKFRPKFRERMQSLTDIELILVEMWFERSLMEYDRVFASMTIPACCWRRTGEIFRGNKEMAELIGVPIESLRDGKLAIHEIIVEDQLVSYWEKFGAIAFDNTQKAMLTSCTLKNPNSSNPGNGIQCCFSFTIRRDNHNINQSNHYRAKVEAYMTEYYMLRVYLSWLQGRSDIAEHLFSKVPQASRGRHQETVMDICYQIGAQAISRLQLDVAARWLERALSSSELLQETQEVISDLKDKKLQVLTALARVSLQLDTADAKRGLGRAVVCLKSEYEDAFGAQVLQLEVLSKENIPNCDEYAEILRRAVAILELNDADLKTGWTERVFISLVWALTESHPCALDCIAVLKDVTQSLFEFGCQPLSEEATNACLILVWKHIDAAISMGDMSHAERCCEFLLEQPLFQISSDSKGRILRKLISCSRDDASTLEAHTVIVRHPEECKPSASTLYMLYGVALRDDDSSLALKRANNEGRLPLYSSSELEWFAKKSYNVALDIHRTSPSEPVVHLLDISFKFTDLYHKKTGAKDRAFMYLLVDYVKSNKLIANARGHIPSSAKAYKQIRQSVERFETHIQAQLDTCTTIPERVAWIHKHRLLIALDFEAAINLKQWNEIPDIIERGNKILDDHLCSVFLDCILRCGASAPNIAQVVKVKQPRPVLTVNLTKAQDIICIFHSSPSPSFSAEAFHRKLPRYLRCLFQIAVEATDYSLAESVLQQAIVLARDGSADTDLPFEYPSDELKWLATMAFNRAVDLYLASADEDCRKWGEIAFTLAGFVKDDGGALLRMLRQNYAKLM